MPTLPEQSLALADEFDRRADEHEAEAVKCRHLAALLRSQAAAEEERLTIADNRDIVRPVTPAQYRSQQLPPGRHIVSGHPFPRALKAARISVSTWAKENKRSRSAVNSWFADGDHARPIPRRMADKIEREFKIPATVGTWKNGISED